jgi:CheY-like chemotaxis protein
MMNAYQVPSVLLADDNPDDRLLIKEAWEEVSTITLHMVGNGEELMDFLYCQGQDRGLKDKDLKDTGLECLLPSLILLDLNMPRKNGYETLQEIKADPKLKKIPVIILTTSTVVLDVNRSYELGASGYLTKPDSFDELIQQMQASYSYWLKTVRLP